VTPSVRHPCAHSGWDGAMTEATEGSGCAGRVASRRGGTWLSRGLFVGAACGAVGRTASRPRRGRHRWQAGWCRSRAGQGDDGNFPFRWRGTVDYGPSRFGRYPGDPPSCTGRRMDFLGRSLRAPRDAGPVAAVSGRAKYRICEATGGQGSCFHLSAGTPGSGHLAWRNLASPSAAESSLGAPPGPAP